MSLAGLSEPYDYQGEENESEVAAALEKLLHEGWSIGWLTKEEVTGDEACDIIGKRLAEYVRDELPRYYREHGEWPAEVWALQCAHAAYQQACGMMPHLLKAVR